MFRGINYFGPGFWMEGRGRGRFPGAGGFRRGGGFGRGWCRYRLAWDAPHFGAPPWAGPSSAGYTGREVDESEYLKAEAAALRSEAEAIKSELAEIERRMAEIEQLEEE